MQSLSTRGDLTPAPVAGGWAATRAAQAVLRGPSPTYTDVIVWLSEHLAALGRVVQPAATARLGADAASVRRQQVSTRRVEGTLRLLHGRLNGDTAAAHLTLAHLHQSLDEQLTAQLEAEAALAAELQPALDPAAWHRLLDRYAASVATGPTRPHPHSPHGRLTGRAAWHLLSAADHLMDVLDSRPVHDLPAPPPTEPAAVAGLQPLVRPAA